MHQLDRAYLLLLGGTSGILVLKLKANGEIHPVSKQIFANFASVQDTHEMSQHQVHVGCESLANERHKNGNLVKLLA